MPITPLASQDWEAFLTQFSRRHQGWLVRVEVSSPNAEPELLAHDLPLQGISIDQPRLPATLFVRAGALSHAIEAPLELRVQTTDVGADYGLEITSADGTVTRVSFRVAILPELVDGLREEELPLKRARGGGDHDPVAREAEPERAAPAE